MMARRRPPPGRGRDPLPTGRGWGSRRTVPSGPGGRLYAAGGGMPPLLACAMHYTMARTGARAVRRRALQPWVPGFFGLSEAIFA